MWIQGESPESISPKLGISPGSIRNIIAELRAGQFPEFVSFVGFLDELRNLSKLMRQGKLSVHEAVIGLGVFKALDQMGVDPSELKHYLQLFQKITPPDFPNGKFATTALHIMSIENETGLSFLDLEARIPLLRSQIATLQTQHRALENEIQSKRSEKEKETKDFERTRSENTLRLNSEKKIAEETINDLELEKQRTYSKNKTTLEQVNRFTAIRSRLAGKGFDIERLGSLEETIDAFSRHGWDPKPIVAYLQKISSLQGETQTVEAQIASVKRDLVSRENELETLTASVTQAMTKLDELQTSEATIRERVSQSSKRIEDNNLQIDLADTLLALFNETPTVSDLQLLQMAESLQLAVKTRRNMQGLPIDFKLLRSRLQMLIEIVLGKKFVTRDFYEESMRKQTDLVADVQLGRLGKLETLKDAQREERSQLMKDREALEHEKTAFANASYAQLLAVAGSNEKKGKFHTSMCRKCGFRIAYAIGTKNYNPPRLCPCCYYDLKKTQIVEIQ